MSVGYFNKKVDYSHEISFWDDHLSKKDRFKGRLVNLLDKKKSVKEFPKIILPLIKNVKMQLTVLEVGSGLTSGLAWGVYSGLLKVTAIDPLATIYRRLLKKIIIFIQ